MRIEFFPEGNQDCPAILFYGYPSAGVVALINNFRLLADGQQVEVALHQLTGVTPVDDIHVFATNAKGRNGVDQLSDTVFRWRRDREGWLEVAELAEPVAQSNPGEGTRFQYLERKGRVNVIFSTDRAWKPPSNPPLEPIVRLLRNDRPSKNGSATSRSVAIYKNTSHRNKTGNQVTGVVS